MPSSGQAGAGDLGLEHGRQRFSLSAACPHRAWRRSRRVNAMRPMAMVRCALRAGLCPIAASSVPISRCRPPTEVSSIIPTGAQVGQPGGDGTSRRRASALIAPRRSATCARDNPPHPSRPAATWAVVAPRRTHSDGPCLFRGRDGRGSRWRAGPRPSVFLRAGPRRSPCQLGPGAPASLQRRG